MTENRYAIPLEELVDSARVPIAAQLVEQPERRLVGDPSAGFVPRADGAGCDADGD